MTRRRGSGLTLLALLALSVVGCHDGRGAPGPADEPRSVQRPAPIVMPQGPVQAVPRDACPATFAELEAQPAARGREGGPLSCVCSVQRLAATPGSVWGSGTYTSDSDICAAAVHAGVVRPRSGGRIAVYGADGCLSYEGTSRHGIDSHEWGEWSGSFHFAQRGAGQCEAMPDNLCPANASGLLLDASTPDATLTCACLPSRSGGSVWGHGRYTTDSSICAAARHAGAIDESGRGEVTIRIEEGCDEYVGTLRHDVRSQPWGPYENSFVVVGHGPNRCPRLD